MPTLLSKVEKEKEMFSSSEEAAVYHIRMAHSHLFEEFEGRDEMFLLSDMENLEVKIRKFIDLQKL